MPVHRLDRFADGPNGARGEATAPPNEALVGALGQITAALRVIAAASTSQPNESLVGAVGQITAALRVIAAEATAPPSETLVGAVNRIAVGGRLIAIGLGVAALGVWGHLILLFR